MSTTSQRRAHRRFRSRALADGELAPAAGASRSFLGSTVNVSAGGALIRTYEPLAVGQSIGVKLRLPEGDFQARATVRHVEIDAVGCRLAGLRFDVLESRAAEVLEKHLAAFGTGPADLPLPTATAAAAESPSWPCEGSVRGA